MAAICVAASSVTAQMADDTVVAQFLTGWRSDSGAHFAAFHVKLAPGWKTYWRVPGDAGIPPRFDWTGSDNIETVQTHWPVPGVFLQNGYRSVGYEDELIIPVQIAPVNVGETMVAAGEMTIGVCKDICVPVTLEFSGTLGADATSRDQVIETALADQPISAKQAGVKAVACSVAPIDDGLRLTVTIEMPPFGTDEHAVVEFADKTVWVSEAKSSRSGDQLTAVADMVPANSTPFALVRSDLRFTVLGADTAVDIRGCARG